MSQKKGFNFVLGPSASPSSTLAEVDLLFDPRGEGRGALKPNGGGRGGAVPPPGGGGGRGAILVVGGGGGGPGIGARGPPEAFNCGGGGGGGGDGAEGGGGGDGAEGWGGGEADALPGPIGGWNDLALPGGGFSGGNPVLPGICIAFPVDVFPPPATVPTGISIFESLCECKSTKKSPAILL